MTAEQDYLALDVGASGGRLVAGRFDGARLQLEEVHRFANGGIWAGERFYWDLLGLWQEMLTGLRKAAGQFSDQVVSVGVDTWGVDFGLLGAGDELLANPRHYRDPHTDGVMERAFEVISREQIFEQTGLQFMQFNSLYQLLALQQADSAVLAAAERLLMIPDLFHWLMTGEKVNEFTNATTSQFFDPQKKDWATDLLSQLDLPGHLLGPVAAPGTRLGGFRKSVQELTGLQGIEVVLPGTHDTASAVVAVPAAALLQAQPTWCYISSGTWSLMGMEIPAPIVNQDCLARNFSNEGGVGDSIRLLKNIAGLWLIQECRRIWNHEGREYGWPDLVRQAEASEPLVSLINPDDASLVAPRDMPQAIIELCQTTSQPAPGTHGAIIRCALESLALRYRMVLNDLEQLTGATVETIHIVGGGTQNRLLCQMTADACNRQVVAGPIEATAIGNVIVQMVAQGAVTSVQDGRELIRNSFQVETYEPRQADPWDRAYEQFVELVNSPGDA
ncbi:MAG: rhamnulokinase family protein [Pirellulaceae bacterium]